ncbi:unnamed protein product [Amoebophrya sp. A25]|nr:unnamed protein product [Amoebophrya sp. A25]|eukprot:GSA25T00006806001.1
MDRFLDPLPQPTLESHEELIEEDDLGANFGLHGKQPVPRKIHETLRRATGCTTPAGGSSASSTRSASKTTLSSFIDSHTGNEWLSYAEGRGTRLRAAAHCVLRRGTGVIKVNGEEDLASRWPLLYNRMELCLPFYVAEACCLFDVFLAVKGGGPSGQAGACRLAVARALATARPACVPLLNSRQLLFEDLRNKLPKDPRRPKARANWRWSKR